jgi:hypothetical protein
VLHGEQYIRVDPPLFNTELLDEIRPWLTLDSDPADHQRLDDRLEAWSLFPSGSFVFVVRLVSAGVYDRRAAYFAHGRAWRRDALPRGFDPGLHLGRSETFAAPWRDDGTPTSFADETPSVVRIEQVNAESQTAARFLAHLLQASLEKYPLIIAAPVADFATGAALHALVGAARAGLPSNLQRGCRIRVYSRFPELFLRHLGVSLLVVPEDAASAALTARPAATLIDRQGRKVAGKEAGERALGYASTVIERMIAIPEGLPAFTARIGEKALADSRAIQITYNLAFAFAGDVDRRADVLRRYLPRTAEKLGPAVPWNDLIGCDEWREFPPETLLDELLTETAALSAGRRELLRVVEDGAARLGMRVDGRLEGWWDPKHPGKIARVIELLAHDPPLVSDGAAAERLNELPLEQLARAASNEKVFGVLARAVSGGVLSPEWAHAFIDGARGDELERAALRWLDDETFFRAPWGDIPELLLDRLRSRARPPAALIPVVTNAGLRLRPAGGLARYLRLADVLTRVQEAEGSEKENPLMTALWTALPRLDEAELETVERIAFDAAWRCMLPSRLDVKTLLALADRFHHEESVDAICEEIDRRMRLDPETTTEPLVRAGWWYFWRRRSRLRADEAQEAAVLRRSALAWLGSSVWTAGTEATLEAWQAALADVRTIDARDAAVLRAGHGKRRWPWIPPFQEQQLQDLVDGVTDVGVLAELAEALAVDRAITGMNWSARQLLARSAWKDLIPADALGLLLDERYGGARPSLTLPEATALLTYAGHRHERALAARIDAIGDMLQRDWTAAFRAAGDPDLWSDGRFLTRVAEWMNGRPSLAAMTTGAAKWIDERADGEPESTPRNPSQSLVRDLITTGLRNAARLVDPALSNRLQNETLSDKVITALINAQVKHGCWADLAAYMRGAGVAEALDAIVMRLRARTLLPRERQNLAVQGWRTFQAAARDHDVLLSGLNDGRGCKAAFGLAAAMLPPGSLGLAALQLAAASKHSGHLDARWWERLVAALQSWKRNGTGQSADDRADAALAVIYAYIDEPDRSALTRALSETRWPVAVEFGEGTS